MRITEDRLSHLAHLVHDALYNDMLVDYSDEDKALAEIKRAMVTYFQVEEKADEAAREKIASLKRGVYEGSREWDIMYRKYFEEELNKHGH